MGSALQFLKSIGFKAKLVTGPSRRSKIDVLTRRQGHYLINCEVCDLEEGGEWSRHSLAYLAGNRWFVDNTPRQKVTQLEDSDLEDLTSVDANLTKKQNHLAHKKAADAIFKQRLYGLTNKIINWYEISRA
jgi:hypothetical protein